MFDYKSTLNLPKTKFPMKGNLKKTEEEKIEKWKNNNLYIKIRKQKAGKPIFFLQDGPPYANGNIHIGHAVNKILKDIIIKSKNLSGYDAPYIPTWDCHGLPIEQKVEKIFGKPGKKISDKKFRKKCREYAISQVELQKKDFIRLGVLADWNNPYLTMNFTSEADIIRTIAEIIKNGHVYQGLKPVSWCLDCESSLSDAEVEYFVKKSDSIIFTLKSKNDHLLTKKYNIKNTNKNIYIAVWTTTPWTIPASKAISINPNIQYQIIDTEKFLIIISKNTTDKIMEKINYKKWKILGNILGKELELTMFIHPFLNVEIPIILSKHVTEEVGTGAVHTAPDHGIEDYIACKKYFINTVNIINSDGTYKTNIHPKIDGINIKKSNKIIYQLLDENKNLLSIDLIEHSYPHCWRHKTPIIYRTTSQWFISMNSSQLRKTSLESIKNVQWIPKLGQSRFESMIYNRPDWCISRQRTWGVPITIFINNKTGKMHPNTFELMNKIAKLIEKKGIEAWWELNTNEILGKDSKNYTKINDVLDVWFESGSIQQSIVKNRHEILKKSHADIYLEGSDQHRGWFMSSLMIFCSTKRIAPFHTVVTHGFVVDQHGKKMSKSEGNSISPNKVIKTLGADILRLWVGSTNYSNDISISEDILAQSSEMYKKIRNTCRFLLSNIENHNPKEYLIQPSNMISLDKWIISETFLLQEQIIILYSQYKFHKIIQKIINYCSITLSSFYLDIIKDRLYTIKKNSIAQKSCQTALFHIIHALVRWISPILSFTADEIWDVLKKNTNTKNIFLQEWYTHLFKLSEQEQLNHDKWDILIQIRNEVNKIIDIARKNKKIKNSLESSITIYCDSNLFKIISILKTELKFMLITSTAIVKRYSLAPQDAIKSIKIPNLKIKIDKASGKKCLRCWNYTLDLAKTYTQEKLKICYRCMLNTTGIGEKRLFI